jgi:thermostable 8-oxoguanine DNA glycosylase
VQSQENVVQEHLQREFEADDEVLPGVRYGRIDELLTPAYWVRRYETADSEEKDFVTRHGTLEEEIGFCLLGGYGVTLEVASAFFKKLKGYGAFTSRDVIAEEQIRALLATPIEIGDYRRRYRFPKQRALRIHNAMRKLSTIALNTSDAVEFRGQLQSLDGIGPKTASWIARNWLGADAIAILDIHILRAGWAINLFDRDSCLPRDYYALEDRFIMFAEELGLRASVLDAVMWTDMRKFGSKLVRSWVAA